MIWKLKIETPVWQKGGFPFPHSTFLLFSRPSFESQVHVSPLFFSLFLGIPLLENLLSTSFFKFHLPIFLFVQFPSPLSFTLLHSNPRGYQNPPHCCFPVKFFSHFLYWVLSSTCIPWSQSHNVIFMLYISKGRSIWMARTEKDTKISSKKGTPIASSVIAQKQKKTESILLLEKERRTQIEFILCTRFI